MNEKMVNNRLQTKRKGICDCCAPKIGSKPLLLEVASKNTQARLFGGTLQVDHKSPGFFGYASKMQMTLIEMANPGKHCML